MSDDDATRMMEGPSVLVHGQRLPMDDSKTPCVGVASMGQTHFGEAEVEEERSTTVTSVRRAEEERASLSSRFQVPRPLALGLGIACGLLCALPVLFGGASNKNKAKPQTTESVSVSLVVEDTAGVRLPHVPMHWGTIARVTDAEGVVTLSRPAGSAEKIVGHCPEGYIGELARQVPRANSPKLWSMKLVCEPNFTESKLTFTVSGCGEAVIKVAGEELGTTVEGHLEVQQRHTEDAFVELEVRSLTEGCQLHGPREVFLSQAQREHDLEWSGSVPRKAQRRGKGREQERPYRL